MWHLICHLWYCLVLHYFVRLHCVVWCSRPDTPEGYCCWRSALRREVQHTHTHTHTHTQGRVTSSLKYKHNSHTPQREYDNLSVLTHTHTHTHTHTQSISGHSGPCKTSPLSLTLDERGKWREKVILLMFRCIHTTGLFPWHKLSYYFFLSICIHLRHHWLYYYDLTVFSSTFTITLYCMYLTLKCL